MNNNCYPLSQNIYNSTIEYPLQFSQNLNYYVYVMPENTQICNMPNINYFPIYPMAYLQNNSQPLLMSDNNDKNEIPLYYNYNNIFPLNVLSFNSALSPQVNNQIQFSSTTPIPPPQDTYFLKKKRSNNVLFENENNKINASSNPEENIVQIKEIQKEGEEDKDMNKTESKILSNEESNIKETNIDEKDEIIKMEENKEIVAGFGENNNFEEEKNKKEHKEETKKKKKKKRNYTELLQDTFLEHIGDNIKVPTVEENPKPKQNSKSSKNLKDINSKNKFKSKPKIKNFSEKQAYKPIQKSIKKDKNKKIKIKSIRHQKKINHKLTLKNNADLLGDLQKNKNNENTELNPKITKVIFHGDNYENTKSNIDFMKYNFDFSIEEQYKTKKLITDYEHQHIDLLKINENFYDNCNYSNQNLDNIETKWSRKKFNGDNKELKKAINMIRDTFQGRKIDTNEEKCLNILKNNDYNIDEFLNSRKI